jgi:putative RNA 2'-phosphotransferase
MNDDLKPSTPGDPRQEPISERCIAWAISAARVCCDHPLTRDELVDVLAGRIIDGPAYGTAVSGLMDLSDRLLAGLIGELVLIGLEREAVIARLTELIGPRARQVADQLVALGRLLSRVLRHEPDLAGVQLDPAGWVSVDELVAGLEQARSAPGASRRLRSLPQIARGWIVAVVHADPKQRFTLDTGTWRIRAAQGHSVPVELGYTVSVPPAVLYHGTARSRLSSIARGGLVPGARHAVHLSEDLETARRVGARHGDVIVLTIDAAGMHAAGTRFERSENSIWLVDHVPPEHISGLDQ